VGLLHYDQTSLYQHYRRHYDPHIKHKLISITLLEEIFLKEQARAFATLHDGAVPMISN
jgi:hypothetical protein